jgi:hypothetical protein
MIVIDWLVRLFGSIQDPDLPAPGKLAVYLGLVGMLLMLYTLVAVGVAYLRYYLFERRTNQKSS